MSRGHSSFESKGDVEGVARSELAEELVSSAMFRGLSMRRTSDFAAELVQAALLRASPVPHDGQSGVQCSSGEDTVREGVSAVEWIQKDETSRKAADLMKKVGSKHVAFVESKGPTSKPTRTPSRGRNSPQRSTSGGRKGGKRERVPKEGGKEKVLPHFVVPAKSPRARRLLELGKKYGRQQQSSPDFQSSRSSPQSPSPPPPSSSSRVRYQRSPRRSSPVASAASVMQTRKKRDQKLAKRFQRARDLAKELAEFDIKPTADPVPHSSNMDKMRSLLKVMDVLSSNSAEGVEEDSKVKRLQNEVTKRWVGETRVERWDERACYASSDPPTDKGLAQL